MKYACCFFAVFFVFFTHAQRSMIPDKKTNKKAMFGKTDLNEYRPFGLMLSVGPTLSVPTRHRAITHPHHESGRPPYDFTTQPEARAGVFAELGLIHYPKKRSKLSQKWNYIFVSYIDWGLGLKMWRGQETTQIDNLHPTTLNVLSSEEFTGVFRHLNASARITAHKNFYIRKKFFIDNGLGLNFDINLKNEPDSDYTAQINDRVSDFHQVERPLIFQLHYELGFGFRLNRRSLLIPTIHVPFVGILPDRNGASDFKWFDSNYFPLIAKIKWTYLFGEKKDKVCPPVYTNEQDQNTMKQSK